ncbi:MAG: hypothetical protein Q4F21_12895 [Lachnospiraceae bacterium]|nr:hypothetical protein [Lachnospiraceae bacterium]
MESPSFFIMEQEKESRNTGGIPEKRWGFLKIQITGERLKKADEYFESGSIL